MKASVVSTVVGAIGVGGVLAFAAAFMWIGRLENRVEHLEKQADALSIGPRGQNCQQIIGALVKQPKSQDLKTLADEFGCSGFAAATSDAPTANINDWVPANDANKSSE